MSVPKVIHYCWFGRRPLPALAVKCIQSWRKYFPDYEIKEWNEDNFNVNSIAYTREAYKSMKYAFVSDYARFWILYHYGGLYFDTDVEVIRPMDDILENGPYMGCERDNTEEGITIAPGLGFASEAKSDVLKALLNEYNNRHFDPDNIDITIVGYTTEYFKQRGFKNEVSIQQVDGFTIYPKEYFCPALLNLSKNITKNTRTIHHYAGTWLPFHKRVFSNIYTRYIIKNKFLMTVCLKIKELTK